MAVTSKERRQIEADVERRLREEMDYQAGMVAATEAVILGEIDICTLAKHLADRFESRAHYADRDEVLICLGDVIAEKVIIAADDATLIAELDTRGIIPFDEDVHVAREDIDINYEAERVATEIGNDWPLHKDVGRIKHLLDRLGTEIRYNGGYVASVG